MAVHILPPRRTGIGEFTEAFKPGLEKAFMLFAQAKMEERQRQQSMEQAQKMFPTAFEQQISPEGLKYGASQLKTIEQGAPIQAEMPVIPDKYKSMVFNPEKAPAGFSMKFGAGGVPEFGYEKKPESAFDAYYRSLIPTPGATGTPNTQNNIVYRTVEGVEVSPEQAQADIQKGNTNYFISKKEITKSGVKENVISKPKDLEKVQAVKEKSDFVISQAQDTLNTIKEVENGINDFGLMGGLPSIPGTKRFNWETNVNKLLSGKVIDLMTQMKQASKTGATGFGQLSEKEGQILKEASTALKRGLAPKDAQKYINVMKQSLQKVIEGSNQAQGQSDFSQMSDEELRRIASGG